MPEHGSSFHVVRRSFVDLPVSRGVSQTLTGEVYTGPAIVPVGSAFVDGVVCPFCGGALRATLDEAGSGVAWCPRAGPS